VSEQEPDPGAVDPAEAVPPRHPVLAVLITLAGIVLLVMTTVVAYSLAAMYGSGSGALGAALIWSLLPAAVIAIGLRHAYQTFAGRVVGWPRLLLVAYAIGVVAIGLASWTGEQTHRQDQARADAACTSEGIAALRSLPGFNSAIDEPTGGTDGACRLSLALRADEGKGLETLVAAMTAAGWTDASGSQDLISIDGEQVDAAFRKDGITVVVSQRDSGKNYTDFTMTIPPER